MLLPQAVALERVFASGLQMLRAYKVTGAEGYLVVSEFLEERRYRDHRTSTTKARRGES